MKSPDELRQEILSKLKDFYLAAWPKKKFVSNVDTVRVSGMCFDEQDLINLVDSSLDFWLTSGRYVREFEKSFADFIGVRSCLLTNSGSSANLLAVSALTSPLLGERKLNPGDEVITVACGFPTTVNPIIQNGLIPVFVDVSLPTYNIDVSKLVNALSPKTKAIILAHTLGNPFDLEAVVSFCKSNNLWLIEDCCDAVGSQYKNQNVGTFGDLATVSFYPAHHITMGEGGAVLTNKPLLRKIVESFRDWGRDCWCEPGASNTCGKRFCHKLGELPEGYDHKYIYSHIGYNLKVTDMQAAIGVSQLKKLPYFVERRKENFNYLKNELSALSDKIILPEATKDSSPSWFGFPVTLKSSVKICRNDFVQALGRMKIETRHVFAGNITRQPAYQHANFKVVGGLDNSDNVLLNSFWIGTFPELEKNRLNHIVSSFREILS